jgi:hypothetical protein
VCARARAMRDAARRDSLRGRQFFEHVCRAAQHTSPGVVALGSPPAQYFARCADIAASSKSIISWWMSSNCLSQAEKSGDAAVDGVFWRIPRNRQ